MSVQARYVHTNLVARDWHLLADFYGRVFDCQPVLPERHLEEDWVGAATGIKGNIIELQKRDNQD